MSIKNYLNKIIEIDAIQLMKQLPDDSIDLILTDIPYNAVSKDSNGIRVFNKKKADELTFNLQEFINECLRVLKGSVYIFCGKEQVSFIFNEFEKNKLSTRLCIWEKTNPSPVNGQYTWLSGIECFVFGKNRGAVFNEHCKNTVFRFPNGRSKIHPTEKSLKLFEYLVIVSSNKESIVLDPCCGSGTTAIACKNLGRKFICGDINGKFIKIANKRFKNV